MILVDERAHHTRRESAPDGRGVKLGLLQEILINPLQMKDLDVLRSVQQIALSVRFGVVAIVVAVVVSMMGTLV